MKFAFFAMALMAPAFAMSAESSGTIEKLLSGYESVDDNGLCSISYNPKSQKLAIRGSNTRASLTLRIENVDTVGSVLVGSSNDYDGAGEVLFIRKPYSLKVVATWQDGELGNDKSSFCEVSLKE